LLATTNQFLEDYIVRTQRSKEVYEKARKFLPGGVSSNGKFMKPHPMYFKEARGSAITDVDGNVYIDYQMGAGANILGHSSPCVIEAIHRQSEIILHPAVATELEVELAQKIEKYMPHISLLRFVNSGSEAATLAVRAARAFTKRNKIAKFEGHYHGQGDNLLVSVGLGGLSQRSGPDNAPVSTPENAGIMNEIVDDVVTLPFNDTEYCLKKLRENSKELAAVIMEPIAGFGMGGIPAKRDFLEAIRETTEDLGILLIFDEVVTGFRIGMGGAAEYYKISPDLTTLGKIIGGGLPVGAYGGREDIMEKVVTPTREPSDLEEKIFSSGTYSGNPMTMAAGLAVLKELEKGEVHRHINNLGSDLRNGLESIASDCGEAVRVTGLGSLFMTHFSSEPIQNMRDVVKANSKRLLEYHLGKLSKGIFIIPKHIGVVSAAHTKEEIERTLDASREVMRAVSGTR